MRISTPGLPGGRRDRWAGLILSAEADAGKYNLTLSIGDAAPAWKDLPGVD